MDHRIPTTSYSYLCSLIASHAWESQRSCCSFSQPKRENFESIFSCNFCESVGGEMRQMCINQRRSFGWAFRLSFFTDELSPAFCHLEEIS